MNKKIIIIVVVFLLMIPFRLPISVLFIHLISDLANLTGNLPNDILSANVVLTKIIYNVVLAAFSINSIRLILKNIYPSKKDEMSVDGWLAGVILTYTCYIIFDAATTHSLFFALR